MPTEWSEEWIADGFPWCDTCGEAVVLDVARGLVHNSSEDRYGLRAVAADHEATRLGWSASRRGQRPDKLFIEKEMHQYDMTPWRADLQWHEDGELVYVSTVGRYRTQDLALDWGWMAGLRTSASVPLDAENVMIHTAPLPDGRPL